MHSIMVKRVDGIYADDASVLAQDITTSVDAWSIAANIASSYVKHGISRSETMFWFKSAAGLHYIWAEQADAVSRTISLSERVATLLFGERRTPLAPQGHRPVPYRHAA